MGEVKPRILPNGAVYYPNPPAKVLLALLPVAALIGSLVAMPYFLHVFKPIAIIFIGIPITTVGFLVALYLISRGLVLSVEIGPDYVVLRYIFKKRVIVASEVRRIELDPPVYSDSLEYYYWRGSDSVCWIAFQDGRKEPVSLLANGVKLRIARVLDPQNFPVAE